MEKTLRKIKKYKVEIMILTAAFLITITSLILDLKSSQNNDEEVNQISPVKLIPTNVSTNIYVDVSGSVNKPDLYKASDGTRLKEIIKMAGWISNDADKNFFARNFNLARIVVDQEKIYIPSIWEISNGYFTENPQAINYLVPENNQSKETASQPLININTATMEELDTIDNRPFGALDEILNKKIVNKTVFENIQNLVTIND